MSQDDPVKAQWQQMKDRQQARIDKHRVVPAIVKAPPVGLQEQSADFTLRNLSNFTTIAGTCVGKTSQVTYTTGWSAFNEYCKFGSIDPSLKVVPTSLCNKVLPFLLPVMVIGSFMAWLSVDKGLNPNTVAQYTSHVRDGFRQQLVDYGFFDHVVLKQVRQSLKLSWALKESRAESFSKRLPMTIEMLEVMRKNVVSFNDLEDHASYVACIMAFTMILRRSHLVMTAANHFIRAKDVVFKFYNPVTKVSWECTATDAYKHSVKHLVDVSVWIRSSKVDVLGENGYMISYSVQTVSDSCAFCVATLMFDWARLAKPIAENPFLSFNGNVGAPWALSAARYSGIIKRTAGVCGFNPKWFDTHSNRIGGATVMAADGHPNHNIQRAGGWSSLCFLDYVQWSQRSWDSVLCSLVNPKIFTNDQMKKLNPSAVAV